MKAKNDKANLPVRPAVQPQGRINLPRRQKGIKKENDLSGYPVYPDSEDIYSKFQEEREINPEDLAKTKELNDSDRINSENDFNENMSGSDLDIPGAELDDNQENIGSEDEENNYYSLGGDDHDDLEEDKGD